MSSWPGACGCALIFVSKLVQVIHWLSSLTLSDIALKLMPMLIHSAISRLTQHGKRVCQALLMFFFFSAYRPIDRNSSNRLNISSIGHIIKCNNKDTVTIVNMLCTSWNSLIKTHFFSLSLCTLNVVHLRVDRNADFLHVKVYIECDINSFYY